MDAEYGVEILYLFILTSPFVNSFNVGNNLSCLVKFETERSSRSSDPCLSGSLLFFDDPRDTHQQDTGTDRWFEGGDGESSPVRDISRAVSHALLEEYGRASC